MARYHGGEKVRKGFYWSPARWEIVSLPRKGGPLPGTKEVGYLRLPLALLMVVGPFLGGLFVVFLPLIGFAMLFWVGGTKFVGLCRNALASLSADAVLQKEKD